MWICRYSVPSSSLLCRDCLLKCRMSAHRLCTVMNIVISKRVYPTYQVVVAFVVLVDSPVVGGVSVEW